MQVPALCYTFSLMEKADKALWRALRRVARPEQPLDLLVAVWPVMIGERLAAHTRPAAWHRGRVDISVDDSQWLQQLEGLKEKVRKQINRWWGTELVREVRFVRERRPATPRMEKKAASRADSSKQEHTAVDGAAESRLQAALKELEPALAGIRDDDLRDLIARVASRYLAGSKP